MKILYSLEFLPKLKEAHLAIGSFDGFHLGHQEIFHNLFRKKSVNSAAILISFINHPKYDLYKDLFYSRSILTFSEKIDFLKQRFKFDYLVFLSLKEEIANLSHEFFFALLKEKVDFLNIYIGENFHFGKDRKGDINFLKSKTDLFFSLNIISYIKKDNIRISSSSIRNLIFKARVEKIRFYLGYDFFITGVCIQGKKLGRNLGYPTINLEWDQDKKMHPPYGVYYTLTLVNGKLYHGMSFLGKKLMLYPREINDPEKSNVDFETHLFDFNMNLYGRKLKVFFKKKIRNVYYFKNLDNLKKQLDQDKKDIFRIISFDNNYKLDYKGKIINERNVNSFKRRAKEKDHR